MRAGRRRRAAGEPTRVSRKRDAGRPAWRRLRRRPLRWVGLAALAAILGALYYGPVSSYVERRELVAARTVEIRALRAEKRSLERRVARIETDAELLRQARRLGLVKPGERLFIVKGIPAWRRAQRTGG